MKPQDARLKVEFSYDHVSGLFHAHLASGTVIPVQPNHVAGKLANALALFRRGVIDLHEQRAYRPTKPKGYSDPLYDPDDVRRFTPSGRPIISLEDIGL